MMMVVAGTATDVLDAGSSNSSSLVLAVRRSCCMANYIGGLTVGKYLCVCVACGHQRMSDECV